MRYQVFGRTGLKVSSLVLGAGNFGTGWGYGSERDEAKAVYDAYRAAGGNFVDTADFYQAGQSESLLGEFIAVDRDDIVLGTKFTFPVMKTAGLQGTGNSRKTMVQALEASLKRLRTDRVDFFWVHAADGVTPIDEIARGLDDLARAGKILYASLSDFPAWRVATAATTAEFRGWTPISALQIEYSLVERTVEAELLPMAAGFGLGVVGWSPLGGGLLTGKYRRGEMGRKQGLGTVIHDENDARKTAAIDAVLAVAEEAALSPSQVAIAWVLAKRIVPIIGPRTLEQLTDNLAATRAVLSADQIARLDAASAVPLGFPHEFLNGRRNVLAAGKADLLDYPTSALR